MSAETFLFIAVFGLPPLAAMLYCQSLHAGRLNFFLSILVLAVFYVLGVSVGYALLMFAVQYVAPGVEFRGSASETIKWLMFAVGIPISLFCAFTYYVVMSKIVRMKPAKKLIAGRCALSCMSGKKTMCTQKMHYRKKL